MATFTPTRVWQTYRSGTTYATVAQSSTATSASELGMEASGTIGQSKIGSTYTCSELHLTFDVSDLGTAVGDGWTNEISFTWDLYDSTNDIFNVLALETNGASATPDHLSSTEIDAGFGTRVISWTMVDDRDDPEPGEEWTLHGGGTLTTRLEDAIADAVDNYEGLLTLTFVSSRHRNETTPTQVEILTGAAEDAILTVETTPPITPSFATAAPTFTVTDKPKETPSFTASAPVLTIPSYTGPVNPTFSFEPAVLEVGTARTYAADNLFGTIVDEQRWTGELT